jgi:hypothetical protein
MKRTIGCVAVSILMVLSTSLCFAEDDSEKAPIKVEKKGLAYRYTYREIRLRHFADFSPIMEDYPDALSHLNKAKTNNVVAAGIGFVGGFLVGWPLGETIAGSPNPHWEFAAVGGGLVVVSAFFGAASGKQLREGINVYNESIASTDARSPDIEVAVTVSGVFVGIRF